MPTYNKVRYIPFHCAKVAFAESSCTFLFGCSLFKRRFLRRETTDVDVPAVYHQLNDTYHSSESEMDEEDKPSTSKQKSVSSRNLRSQEISQDWKLACRQLLESLWQCEDSIPFR